MAVVSSEFYRQKLSKKRLILELEDNEDIHASVKLAMKEHGLKECSIELMEGTIKAGKMSAVIGSAFKVIEMKNSQVLNGSGHFKLSFDELFGSIRVLAKTGKPENGVLSKGIVNPGFKIVLGFYK